ncbi:MAG: zinc-ribbon domain-containing protein [Prevotella sp.]|nr:zinc-ribbon domain-containing protein [Prevotella sp.]
MYCKYCGKEIADDSKFCQHCGGEQVAQSSKKEMAESKSGTPIEEGKVIEIPTIKTNFSERTKWLLLAYGTWFIFNLYWLLVGNKASDASEYFRPFSSGWYSSLSYYDITEFLIYVVGVPLAIWGVKMLKQKIDKTSNTPTPKDT